LWLDVNKKLHLNSAFTLVELAIVIVIIGFIAGGIMVGNDMIHAAEIRSVIKDIDNYKSAIYTFREKYNCLASDCSNATAYFGAENANPATCQATASTGTLTCDGNGNGQVDYVSYENYRFWQHLAIAGLIKGKYTGVNGGNSSYHILGVNAPASAISGAGFSFAYLNYPSGDSATYGMNYGNFFWFGMQRTLYFPYGDVFTPSEALAVEQKIDDGKPGTGMVIMRQNTYGWNNPNSCTTSTGKTDYTGNYRTNVVLKSCAFMIKSGIY
jgi:prepilin-type N-terminal cleavage/methylation domain-containing protein